MRAIYLLVIMGLLIGTGGASLLVGIKLLINRKMSRTFLYLGWMFTMFSVFFLLFIAALDEIPKPRPQGFISFTLACLVVLSLGMWPVIVHLTMLTARDEKKSDETGP